MAERATSEALLHGVEVMPVNGPASLSACIAGILSRRQRHVMVLAGDGTVRAIVDQLASLPAGAWVPDLLVLPGGRTNMTASDLTPGSGAIRLIRRAVQAVSTGRWEAGVVDRATLCIEQSPAPPRHGFWLGAAVVDSVIRRTHEHRANGSGLSKAGPLSTVSSILRLIFLALRGKSGIESPVMDIDAGRTGHLQGAIRVLVATTLHHRTGLFDPFAARTNGGMRLTAVTRHAPHFWRSLPRLLTGRFSRSMTAANGFLSGGCEVACITGLAHYSLDGEAFDTDPYRPVLVRQGPRLRFYRP